MGFHEPDCSELPYHNEQKYVKTAIRMPEYFFRHRSFSSLSITPYQKLFVRCFFVSCIFICLGYFFLFRRETPVVINDYEVPTPEQALVFIGGHPRSGTTLLRIMMDVHPMIRCGPETHVLPALLGLMKKFETEFQRKRLEAAELYPDPLYRASSAFINSILEDAGEPAPLICNKDPLVLQHIKRLKTMFPKAKFIHIVRDGRAVTNSMIKRKIRMNNASNDPNMVFARWERIVRDVDEQCSVLTTCYTVLYEDLVLRPNYTMHRLLNFLNIPWDPVVLHHETAMKNETLINAMEPSSSQVVHPIHTEALSSWATSSSVLSMEFIERVHVNSELLQKFGYADRGFPPFYGTPEPEVELQTNRLRNDKNFLKVFG